MGGKAFALGTPDGAVLGAVGGAAPVAVGRGVAGGLSGVGAHLHDAGLVSAVPLALRVRVTSDGVAPLADGTRARGSRGVPQAAGIGSALGGVGGNAAAWSASTILGVPLAAGIGVARLTSSVGVHTLLEAGLANDLALNSLVAVGNSEHAADTRANLEAGNPLAFA